jgi:hypothetical protein
LGSVLFQILIILLLGVVVFAVYAIAKGQFSLPSLKSLGLRS